MNIYTNTLVSQNVSIMVFRNNVVSLLVMGGNQYNRLLLPLVYSSNQPLQHSDILKLSIKIKAHVPDKYFMPPSGHIPVQQL